MSRKKSSKRCIPLPRKFSPAAEGFRPTEPKKVESVHSFTEEIFPGPLKDSRQPNEKELKATSILRLPLTEVSAKIRVGPPEDDAPDYLLPIWAGVIPLQLTPGAPIRDEKCDPLIPTPAYAAHYKR